MHWTFSYMLQYCDVSCKMSLWASLQKPYIYTMPKKGHIRKLIIKMRVRYTAVEYRYLVNVFCSVYLIVPGIHLLWIKMCCFKAIESKAIFSCTVKPWFMNTSDNEQFGL